MAFPPGFLDDLRNRISLSGLISRRVKLQRRGREFAGLCPFHHEKTPSFYVVEEKSFFHCFGCGAHGDAIGFAMRADNLDFIEAVEKLAGEAGLPVPQATPQERERAQRQKTLLEATEAAAAFYETRLWAPAGSRAREYLEGRGLDAETMRRFRLGWAPDDRHALRRALQPEFPDALLIEAGLLRRAAEDSDPWDYFRNRVVFPIGDRAGRVIAFGGRLLGDGQPKYLNSPDTPLFEKGRVLYGWSAARAASARQAERAVRVVVTEGYMDVIALHRTGLAAAVAPLGTALTEFQLSELWRLAPEPILCFDGDAAGQHAAARALRRALPLLQPGRSLRFATLPPGEDPDSLIRHSGGGVFEQILAAAQPLSSRLWDIEAGGKPLDTPERRADLGRRLTEAVNLIADRTVQNEYRRFVRDRMFGLGRSPRPRPATTANPRPSFVRDGPEPPPRSRRNSLIVEHLFRIVLHFPWLISEVAEEFAGLEITEPELDRLRRQILAADAGEPGLDAYGLRQHLVQTGHAAAVDRLFLPSVEITYLVRRSDPNATRKEWVRAARMLTGGDDCVLAEVSAKNWERFLAARQTAAEARVGDDQT
jgi:DNA primase